MPTSVPLTREAFEAQCAAASVVLPYSDDCSVLSTPLDVGGRTAANRIAYQAMEGCDTLACVTDLGIIVTPNGE